MRYMLVAKTFFIVTWGVFAVAAAHFEQWDIFAMCCIGASILGFMPTEPL